ncbi:hypothetical protein AB0C76_32865 [Kitasatospora sp. NPDC048722]|uniref:hypothetical protein n=1 Tax=Kitasatospora sp. NPDC048722 TaxID=3155639 RepID=UPI00340A9AA7
MSTPEDENDAADAARRAARVARIHELMRKHTKPELLRQAYALGLARANAPEQWRKDEIATTLAELEQRAAQRKAASTHPGRTPNTQTGETR